MFGIKMPWTLRKERLAKELADKLALEAVLREVETERLRMRQVWLAKIETANRAARSLPRTTELRYGERALPNVNTDNHDMLMPALITLAILNNMNSNGAASSYCAPDSGASSYTPSYSSSCSSDSYVDKFKAGVANGTVKLNGVK